MSTQISLRGLTREVLLTDEFSQWAITTPLYNIGEQVYQLTPELKEKYPQQPWNAVVGLRHRLVHDYDGINWILIVEIVFDDMPTFIQNVRTILEKIS